LDFCILQLLILGDNKSDYTDGIPNPCCWITKHPHRIHYTLEGEEYCFVEVTCKDGVQYGIQAFGDEAVALYIEANRCYLCGISTALKKDNNNKEKIEPFEEIIDGALIFKKLKSVYGRDFYFNN
jgi:hypothetical protein